MKIHWLKTLAAKKRRDGFTDNEAYCGNLRWESLSSDAENVDCRMCVQRMIKVLDYRGNKTSGVWHGPN